MDLSALVLWPGMRAGATGRVVAVGGRVTFEPTLPTRLVRHAPGHAPPARPSGIGVPVAGVDMTGLEGFRSKQGTAEGWAHLVGEWTGDTLVVDAKGTTSHRAAVLPRWDRPPCPPPAGGWAHEGTDGSIRPPAGLESDPSVTNLMMVRPSPTQIVLVVVSTEPEQVRSRLGPEWTDRACVVDSRWTPAQLRAARARLDARMLPWQLYSIGQSADEDCQTILTVEAVRVLPELVDWARDVPDGLLDLHAWLMPVTTASIKA